MAKKQTQFEAQCPSCGEKSMVAAGEEHIQGDKVSVRGKCPRCLSPYDAVAELDCLEWDDQCTMEVGRFG